MSAAAVAVTISRRPDLSHLHASLELVCSLGRAYRHRFSHSREYPIVMIGYVARRGSRCSRLVAVERHAPSASKFRL